MPNDTHIAAFFDIPKSHAPYSPKGSSPTLVDALIHQFCGATKMEMSFFLYNNPYIHQAIETLAREHACEVVIYSIPLDGYDRRKRKITLSNGKTAYFSKHEYAAKIVDRLAQQDLPIELRYVPHTNVWSKQRTSRGNDSYALHNKSILLTYEDGSQYCMSTSSNMALGDPPHSENLFITNEAKTIQMFRTYFDSLHQHSFNLSEYHAFRQHAFDFEYITQPTDIPDEYGTCYFTAPFLTYHGVGSNHYVQRRVIEWMQRARHRLYLCFQHIGDYRSFDRQAGSVIQALGDLAAAYPSLDIKVMKQTRASHQRQGTRTSQAERFLQQFSNVEQRSLFPVVHDKFMIVDNELLVTTANLTPTQFAWAQNHPMVYTDGTQSYEVSNTFSDINSFHFVPEHAVVDDYLHHFEHLWRRGDKV